MTSEANYVNDARNDVLGASLLTTLLTTEIPEGDECVVQTRYPSV